MAWSGCANRAAPPPAGTRASAPVDPDAQAALDALAGALRTGDRAAVAAQLDRTDPRFEPWVGRLLRNAGALPWAELTLRLRGPRTDLDPGDRAELGADAWAQTVTVRERLADDRGTAERVLPLVLRREDGRTRVAGIEQADRGALPLWWQQDIVVRRADRVSVLASDGVRAAAWLSRGRSAVRAVASRLPANLAAGWSRRLVVEVPDTVQAFERVLGVTPGSHAQLAAVAWPQGFDRSTAAVRVVINPRQSARLEASSTAILLAHEVVHVATRSVDSAAPTWLVEGYADYLAYAAHPEAEAAASRALLAAVRQDGPPAGPPSDAAFAAGATDLDLAYATAWHACRFLATSASPAALGRLYAQAGAGSELETATRAALGPEAPNWAARWRRELAAEARGTA